MSRARKEAYDWDKVDAQRWANSLKNYTTRRFRIQYSRAGNSRLVTFNVAKELKEKYGGEIIEMVKPLSESRNEKLSINETKAQYMPKCPKCKEAKGKPCRTPQGAQRKPHSARITAEAKKKAKKK